MYSICVCVNVLLPPDMFCQKGSTCHQPTWGEQSSGRALLPGCAVQTLGISGDPPGDNFNHQGTHLAQCALSASAVQLFGRVAVLETHTLWY